jgi:hypothetical protein
MIHYQLQCPRDHAFDGWFPGSAAFESQAQRGLLECPVCGSADVTRALMAPAVPKKGNALTPAPAKAVAPSAGETLPDGVRAALQRLRAEVEKNFDYMGDKFADEALRIHKGEIDPRGIYGEATPEQAEALADEGVQLAQIPWLPRADS